MKILIMVTLGFIVFDLATGIIKAFKEKSYTSSVMREGLFHKAGSILLIMLAILAEYGLMQTPYKLTVPLTGSVCAYIIAMETGSAIENIGKINPTLIPEKIKPYFSKLSVGERK